MVQAYDYIVIGAGSAGCVVANRLSADGENSVLVLEAGGWDKHPNIRIPGGVPKLLKTKFDWDFRTIPQRHCNNRQMYLPRGKVIGGTSSINTMIYIRGHSWDYDNWSKLGNVGWSYQDVLPYFIKMEDNQRLRNGFHGTGGELKVSDQRDPHPLSKVFVEAAVSAGLPRNDDFNGFSQLGAGLYQVTQFEGSRCSASAAFVHPILSRSNLKVITGALVDRIEIDQGRAASVSYRVGTEMLHAQAKMEIVLSAGAYCSPQILMRSGVGPGKMLQSAGIATIVDLPGVGKNLQDHFLSGVLYHTPVKDTLDAAERFPNVIKNLFRYLFFKRGPFTTNIAEAGGFAKTDQSLPAPDIQFHFAPGYYLEHGFSNPTSGNGFGIGVTYLRLQSRGSVKVRSAQIDDPPVIDHNYLGDERDLSYLIRGFRIGQRIASSDEFAPYRKSAFMPPKEELTDDEIIAFCREYGETLYHPTGTCKMGRDRMAVVDYQLRVHGVRGLRVIDASIMPEIIGGNTNAPTMMIAEKGAEMMQNE